MVLKVSEMIRTLRTEKQMSQEKLAECLGVTMQAVSKWENGIACPDITILPVLADVFEVSIDYLLTGKNFASAKTMELPEDDVYRVFWAKGNTILGDELPEELEQKDVPICLEIPGKNEQAELRIEVKGNCTIEGDVCGCVEAQGDVNCGNVNGPVEAAGDVNSGNILGPVDAQGDINCGNVNGPVEAQGDVNCTGMM